MRNIITICLVMMLASCASTDQIIEDVKVKTKFDYPVKCLDREIQICEGRNQQDLACRCESRSLFEQQMRSSIIYD